MAARTANVIARVEPDVKEKAENILKSMGIPSSVAINMFYRQIITDNGLPFQPSKNVQAPKALSEMTREEFDACMEAAGDEWDDDEFYCVAEELRAELPNLTFEKISFCSGILIISR